MLHTTQQQAWQRWDALPLSLREALTAPVTTDFITQACRAQHLPEEKTRKVSEAAALVLFGFLHAEELAHEIKDRAGIDMKIAEEIARALELRILRPLKLDLEKIYSAPHPAQEAERAAPVRIVTETAARPRVDEIRVDGQNLQGAAHAAPPARIESVAIPRAPQSAPTPLTALPRETPAMPQAPSLAPQKGPVIIHEESTLRPVQRVPFSIVPPADQKLKEVKLEKPELTRPARVEMGGVTPTPKAQVPAPKPEATRAPSSATPFIRTQITEEMGSSTPSHAMPPSFKAPQASGGEPKGAATPPRIIHYTDTKTMLESPNPLAALPEKSLPEKTPVTPARVPQTPAVPAVPQERKTFAPPPFGEIRKPSPPQEPVPHAASKPVLQWQSAREESRQASPQPEAKGKTLKPPPLPPAPAPSPERTPFSTLVSGAPSVRGAETKPPQSSSPASAFPPTGAAPTPAKSPEEIVDTIALKKIIKNYTEEPAPHEPPPQQQ